MMALKIVISAVAYLILAPLAGGILTGLGRRFSANLQGKKGAPVMQPFRDVQKLREKKAGTEQYLHDYYVKAFVFFEIVSGVAFFAGANLLFVILSLIAADVFLVMAAFAANSLPAHMGADYELMRMMAYCPMFLFLTAGFAMFCGSMEIRDIMIGSSMPFWPLIGIFAGFLLIYTVKSRTSPFDLSFSSDPAGKRIKGITSEFFGKTLASIEVANWYETVLMLGFVFLFFSNGTIWSHVIGVLAAILVYFLRVFANNCSASTKWEFVVKIAWGAAAVLGAVNLFLLYVMI